MSRERSWQSAKTASSVHIFLCCDGRRLLLNHLRHLLASDPTLNLLGMPGGLDIWLFRNTQKVLEWSGSARDDWSLQNTGLMHRQFIRILDYLDGLSYVQNDVPVDSPVLVNARLARVSLLEFDVQHQVPRHRLS